MVKFNSAYKFVLKDWKKTLKFSFLTILCFFIPIIGNLMINGLMIKLIRNTIKKKKIPKVFENFGKTIMDGLKFSFFNIIISLPTLIIIGFITTSISLDGFLTSNPEKSLNTFIGASINSSLLILFIEIIILSISLLIPILMCNYAKKDKFSAFFEFGKAIKILKNNFGSYFKMILKLTAYLIILILSSIILALITSITVILPILIILFFVPIQMLISSKIIGEWYSKIK